jgi:hypothetical protein
MQKIFECTDEHLGKSYIVISKIREVSKAFSEIVVTFDNGDKRVLSVENPDETLQALLNALKAQ